MCRKIRCDEKCENFCKILNNAFALFVRQDCQTVLHPSPKITQSFLGAKSFKFNQIFKNLRLIFKHVKRKRRKLDVETHMIEINQTRGFHSICGDSITEVIVASSVNKCVNVFIT